MTGISRMDLKFNFEILAENLEFETITSDCAIVLLMGILQILELGQHTSSHFLQPIHRVSVDSL